MLPPEVTDVLRVLGPALAALAGLVRAIPALITAGRRRSAQHEPPTPAVLTSYSGVVPWAGKAQWPEKWLADPEVRRQGWRSTRHLMRSTLMHSLISVAVLVLLAWWIDSALFAVTAFPMLLIGLVCTDALLRMRALPSTATTLFGREGSIVVRGEQGPVWQFCVAATRRVGARLVSVDAEAGEIVATTGSWAVLATGQRIRVAVQAEQDSRFRISIESDVISHRDAGLMMARANKRNVERFLDSWGSLHTRTPAEA